MHKMTYSDFCKVIWYAVGCPMNLYLFKKLYRDDIMTLYHQDKNYGAMEYAIEKKYKPEKEEIR